MLRVKTVTVQHDEQEPFDAQLAKAILGMNVKDIKYSISINDGNIQVKSALILYEA